MKPILPVLLLFAASCSASPTAAYRKVSTSSPDAQAHFDRGLAFLYAFNHDEAIRSFKQALGADSSCTMALWGIATAHGPHINNPAVEPERAKEAWEAIRKAAMSSSKTQLEAEIISAQVKRWSDDPKAERAPLDKAYADAMREVWQRHPKDADVGALFAEALMDLRPWDLWKADGSPQPGTDEVLATLESVMAIDPNHALALHLYIHAVEASPDPGRADAAADRLRVVDTPGLGHLTHMPSHIDVRRGRWDQAIGANRKAIRSDAAYRLKSPEQGFYHIYMAHNRHMLSFAAMMCGRSREATEAAQEMLAAIPEDFVQAAAPFIDGFYAMPYELHVRFGRWDAMLAEKEPRDLFPLTRALWHYARGVSFAAKGDLDAAREEQKDFEARRGLIPKDAVFGNNTAADLAGVAQKLMEAEIDFHAGRIEEALAAAREAVKREDALRYDEPPDWILPTRHVLGAMLLEAGRAADAEKTYRDELVKYPGNGWSLIGLARSVEAQGRDASDPRNQFERVWREGDVKIGSSCLCLPAK